MSRRRPNTAGYGRRARGARGDFGKWYDNHHRELAALDVDCDACQQRIIRLFCVKRPERVTDVGYTDQRRMTQWWFGEDDDVPVALQFTCSCGAVPVVHVLAAVQQLIALVDEGKRTGRMSSST